MKKGFVSSEGGTFDKQALDWVSKRHNSYKGRDGTELWEIALLFFKIFKSPGDCWRTAILKGENAILKNRQESGEKAVRLRSGLVKVKAGQVKSWHIIGCGRNSAANKGQEKGSGAAVSRERAARAPRL